MPTLLIFCALHRSSTSSQCAFVVRVLALVPACRSVLINLFAIVILLQRAYLCALNRGCNSQVQRGKLSILLPAPCTMIRPRSMLDSRYRASTNIRRIPYVIASNTYRAPVANALYLRPPHRPLVQVQRVHQHVIFWLMFFFARSASLSILQLSPLFTDRVQWLNFLFYQMLLESCTKSLHGMCFYLSPK